VRFPAIAEDDETWALDAELGWYSFTRQRGEALHPERQPLAILEQIRPAPADAATPGRSHGQGGMVQKLRAKRTAGQIRSHRAELGHREQAERAQPPPFPPPHRGREGWGCTSWGIKDKDLYLLHVLRKRMEYPELKRAVREQCQAFAANVVLIEAKSTRPPRCSTGLSRPARNCKTGCGKWQMYKSRNKPNRRALRSRQGCRRCRRCSPSRSVVTTRPLREPHGRGISRARRPPPPSQTVGASS